MTERNVNNRTMFLVLLSQFKMRLEYSKTEMIHGYTKEEYINRLNKLIAGEGRWETLQNELFCDMQAFLEMITAHTIIAGLSEKDAIFNALLGAKIYNMFRTWVFIARNCIEKGFYYKDQGLSKIESAQAYYNSTHLNEDDIEFRQVLGHYLNIEFLQVLCNSGVISAQDLSQFVSAADEFINAYENCFVVLNKVLQQEVFDGLFDDTRKE